MASLYRDRNSPYWFIRYKDTDGRWRSKSLRLRHDLKEDTKKAKERAAEYSLDEFCRPSQRDYWGTWVPPYLAQRYRNPKTFLRMSNCWKRISEYLMEKGLLAPQDLNYSNCRAYLPWRTAKRSHNTAVLELSLLGTVCQEALRRGMIRSNPAYKLGYGRIKGKEKPELTDDDIRKIRAALVKEPAWMSHAFEIALHTGCRLGETALFVDDIDINGGKLHFRITKGSKPFTVPLNPALKEPLQNLLRRGHMTGSVKIFDLPPNASRYFHNLFAKIELPVTFHSTRVTVASRLARSGYPLAKAMRLLNHSSELVHRIYQRLSVADVADSFALLNLPPQVSDAPCNENQDAPPATPEHDR